MKQKAARLSARGIKNAFSEPGVEDFLRAACRHGLASGQPLIEIHALDMRRRSARAVIWRSRTVSCFTSMFNSYTLREHSRRSPGLICCCRI